MKSNSRSRLRGSISPRTLHLACSSQRTVCTWASLVDSALVPGATAPSREVGRSPLPTRPAGPTGSTATSLATAIGATAGDKHVRRPSASWWQLEVAHCLLLAPDLRCVACRVVCGVRECMTMAQATTTRPNRHPEATKPHLPPLGGGSGRCGWGGLLAVLTAILACGYALVRSYVDSV
jgi:hypothetical protein